MTMTREDLRDFTREVADMVDSPRWSDTNVDALLGLAQWTEQSGLLNANRQFYLQKVDVTQDDDGRFAIADLTTGSGNDTKHFYRILTVAQPNNSAATAQLYYRETNYESYPNPQPSTSLPYVWYRYGQEIQIIPQCGGQAMSITVNYRTVPVDQLADDGDDVQFPEGYEKLLAYVAGASMLDKGGAEAGAANVLLANAESIRQAMLLDLGRVGTMPIIARSFDNPQDWGSGSYY